MREGFFFGSSHATACIVTGVKTSERHRWTERFPVARLPLVGDLAIATIASGIAFGARILVDPHLPPGFPFLTFFPAVILTAFLFGSRAGALTAILSGLVTWYRFIPPTGFALDQGSAVALAFYAFITATEVALVHWMQRANRLLFAEREANAQLADTRELLFRELQHRVSNNIQMVSALLSIQRKQVADPRAKEALDEASRRLSVVGRISRQLYQMDGSGQALAPFLDQIARDVIDASGRADVAHHVEGRTETQLQPEAAIPLALVVAESIANAIEHGFTDDQEDCRVDIRLREPSPNRILVEVEDNGRGLPSGFKLSGSDSLGLRIATMLTSQLGGDFTLSAGTDRGAVARIGLPA